MNSFTIQEWYFIPLGTWGPSYGTKRLGLDTDDLPTTILYVATSDGMGSDNQEIVVALGLLRSNLTIFGFPSGIAPPSIVEEGPLHVLVYRWTKGENPARMGKTIKTSAHLHPFSAGNRMLPKESVKISTNGRVLSILSYFQIEDVFTNTMAMIKVYEWDDDNDDWKPRQTLLLPESRYISTVSHSLSWDGSVVAIAESYSVDRMTIYRWNTEKRQYIQQYIEEKPVQQSSLLDHADRTTSLSGDGSTLLVSTPLRGGKVLTYRDDFATAIRHIHTCCTLPFNHDIWMVLSGH